MKKTTNASKTTRKTGDYLDTITEFIRHFKYEDALAQIAAHLRVEEDIMARAGLLIARAYIYKIQGKWEEALSDCQEVMDQESEIKDKVKVAKAYLISGEIQSYCGEFQEAVNAYEAAMHLTAQSGSKLEEARSSYYLGSVYSKIGEHQQGLDMLEQAWNLIAKLKDNDKATLHAALWLQKGLQEFRVGKHEAAQSCYQQALELTASQPLSIERAEAYRYLGVIYSLKSDFKAALSSHLEALKIFKQMGYVFGFVKAYNSIGQTCLKMVKLDEAIFFMEKAEKICQELRADSEAATLYGKLGDVYLQKEDYDQAIRFYLRDLEMCRRFGNYRALAYTYRNLGYSYIYKGELLQAIFYLKESLIRFEDLQDEINRGKALADISHAALLHGDLDEAEKTATRALQDLQHYQQIVEVAYVKSLFGAIYRHKKDYAQAQNYLTESVKVLEKAGISVRLAEAYYEYGMLAWAMQDQTRSAQFFKKALKIAQDLHLKRQIERNLAMLERIDEVEIVNLLLEGFQAKK